MLKDKYLPKFDTYQVTIAPYCCKGHANSRCHDILQKKVLSNIRAEIHLLQRNIVSSG